MLLAGLAEDIADDLLYRTGQAMHHGNQQRFSGCFAWPQIVETSDGVRVFETEEEFRTVFAGVKRYYTENNVTDVVRTVVSAEFLGRDTVGAMYVTRLMRPGQALFRDPYPMYSILRRNAGLWKIVSSAYAILDSNEHNKALMATGGA